MSRVGSLVLAVAAALTLVATGCGDDEAGEGGTIIRGTTDQPVSYDPAGAYDLPSYDVIYNTYQNLMTIPAGENNPVPEAAESCDFTNDTTYECTMRDGLTFSDGSPLTAEDVAFSFERNVEIADPNGASSLLANMRSVRATDDRTVAFQLKEPDATWPFVITAASFAIVPDEVYPPDKLQSSDEVVGSGRYTVESYEPGQQTVLAANPEYDGEDPAQNDQAIVQYYDKSSALKLAVEEGEVDIAYRSLSPTELADLRDADGLEVVEGNGTEIRYLVFNLDLQPGQTEEEKLAIRRAAAYTIDREAIASNVYEDTVSPLYSMIPEGVEFASEAFKDEYGEGPDVDAARQELEQAGVQTPVDLEVWWTPSHYGPASGDEYAEIKRQFDESGLFNVTLQNTEWNQYSEAAFTDKYPQYQLGWFPDYPDADDYSSPFYAKDSFLNHHYSNPEMTRLLTQERSTTDDAQRAQAFERIQQIGAEDAPVIPYFQADQVAAVQDGVDGVEETFDPSFIFRFWLITKES
jgi:peptide/nickel transport system substrate-binding protein